ncbi:MAG: flagellar hook-basal body complex protein FliE [Plesiomonas sp.]|uniref:flagellar hook-basal body complex protein FliE n=1 Tax=Plesiomonas sp. TaxID=2486279 RepID=UPI003F3483D0
MYHTAPGIQNTLAQMEAVKSQIGVGSSTEIVAANPLTTSGAQVPSFQAAMTQAVSRVDNLGNTAKKMVTAVDTGVSQDLVGAMIASQKASLSFTALVQVRQKLMTAYDDVMKMPV